MIRTIILLFPVSFISHAGDFDFCHHVIIVSKRNLCKAHGPQTRAGTALAVVADPYVPRHSVWFLGGARGGVSPETGP